MTIHIAKLHDHIERPAGGYRFLAHVYLMYVHVGFADAVLRVTAL